MHRGKGMKFVGDSRVSAVKKLHNKPKDYSEYPGRTEAFWPDFLLKEWMVGAIFLVGFLILIVAHPSPLQAPADPTDASYIALPDWYFLFMYQLLKYPFASGDYAIVGLIIPGLAFVALLLMPFLDTTPERRPSKRPVATSIMLLTFLSMVYLTWESANAVDWDKVRNQAPITDKHLGLVPDIEIDENSEGYKIFSGPQGQACIACHGGDLTGVGSNPMLLGNELTAEQVKEVVTNGRGGMPSGQFAGTEEELEILAEWIASLKAE